MKGNTTKALVIFGAVVTCCTIAGSLVTRWLPLPIGEYLSPGRLIGFGVLSYLVLSIALFSIILIRSCRSACKIDTTGMSEEEQEKLAEEIMLPALQGEQEPSKAEASVFRWPGAFSIGIVVAGILCWLIDVLVNSRQ